MCPWGRTHIRQGKHPNCSESSLIGTSAKFWFWLSQGIRSKGSISFLQMPNKDSNYSGCGHMVVKMLVLSLSGSYDIGVLYKLFTNLIFSFRECSGSVVECLTLDRGVTGSSGVVSLSRHINPCLVLVQLRKSCPEISEKLLRDVKNQTKQNNLGRFWAHVVKMLVLSLAGSLWYWCSL